MERRKEKEGKKRHGGGRVVEVGKEVRRGGGKEGRKEGRRKEGRKEGRKEERKEGRKKIRKMNKYNYNRRIFDGSTEFPLRT